MSRMRPVAPEKSRRSRIACSKVDLRNALLFLSMKILFSGLFFFNSACLIICAVYGVIFHYDRQHALSYVDLIVCKTVRDLLVLG